MAHEAPSNTNTSEDAEVYPLLFDAEGEIIALGERITEADRPVQQPRRIQEQSDLQ